MLFSSDHKCTSLRFTHSTLAMNDVLSFPFSVLICAPMREGWSSTMSLKVMLLTHLETDGKAVVKRILKHYYQP